MSKQLDCFSDFPAYTLARNSDPNTSKQAAADIEHKLAGARGRALYFVRQYPGRTASELAYLAGDGDPRKINRRLNELERLGSIRRGDPVKCSRTGRAALTWYTVK